MAASNIRYDDFVSNVQPDPAKPEPTIMLSGFVGHGPAGHARVYPDPTLGTWYDVPEADVVYSMPIADSKLGGSYIWVRASSEIKPGSAAPAATPALEAQQQPHAAAAMMPTPATHCFICPPHPAVAAAQVGGGVGGGGGGGAPTPATLCIACPLTVERGCVFTPPQTMCCPPTPMTNCHPFCLTPPPPPTPPHTQCCPPHTQPVALCGVVPHSGIVCSQACNVLQAGGGFTPATVCTQGPPCPPNTVNTPCLTMAACLTFPGACHVPQNGVFTPFGR
jgi:hypothetical protein